jgi:hypothetical protein
VAHIDPFPGDVYLFLRAREVAVANNLIALTFGATLGDLTSMEELVY